MRSLLQATAIVGALALVPIATSAMAEVDTDSYRDIDTFMDVFTRLKANYVDTVTAERLTKSASAGMLVSHEPPESYADELAIETPQIQNDTNVESAGRQVQKGDSED